MVGLGYKHKLELKVKLDTRPRFKRAVDCNIHELDSVLDYFAPASERKGNWAHNPKAPDPPEAYRTCYETMLKIDPNAELTMAQYIRRALADKEEGSTAILELTKTLAQYLEKNEWRNESERYKKTMYLGRRCIFVIKTSHNAPLFISPLIFQDY